MTETANAAKSQNCQWCGLIHTSPGVCPMVKALEYYPDGTLKRVELKTGADYPQVAPNYPWPHIGYWPYTVT